MELGFKDVAVLVTGASSGIGRATAIAYGREGARVAITYNSRQDAAEAVVKEIEAAGGEGYAVPMDLGAPETIAAAARSVIEHWGGLDVVVANAVSWGTLGYDDRPEKIEDSKPEWWTQILRANLEGNYHLVQQVAPALRRSEQGRLVLISTDLAERGMAGSWAYGAAKAGLHGLAASLQCDLGADGVLVNVVLPGITLENGEHRAIPRPALDQIAAKFAARHLPETTELADAILFLTSPRTKSVQGQLLRVNGGDLLLG
ncbi:SDR family NAD(P)-dependent oxidoreductase [Kribbella solani]|uniref:3-oxoacyl-[acyl-carrier protein] reductase n=1 Tax=Kribbella solani TaxID=236067 RepID=A0A841DQP9_9ACTN|nr:SDR family NAD(P)-dependent oxidoreductase [Kribbella solani]MBB5980241.1 3-oxoacyl-[acyl-carrier protein] reductase [Kribbella solani]MDX2971246.1 SDR family NAD(P)-dependent oxidoreductase [Kribbella solani]MDX3004581.1 SDR family NAD(P)-dependent oxidoreductase [Kribbella solani]